MSLADVLDNTAMSKMDISTLCNSITSKGSSSNAMVDHGSPRSEYSDEDFVVVDCRTSGSDALLPRMRSEPRFRTQVAASDSITEASGT